MSQKWRALAAHVQPPLTNAKTCSYFVKTLRAPYIDRMIGIPFKDFSEIIRAGKMIDILVSVDTPFCPGQKNKKK